MGGDVLRALGADAPPPWPKALGSWPPKRQCLGYQGRRESGMGLTAPTFSMPLDWVDRRLVCHGRHNQEMDENKCLFVLLQPLNVAMKLLRPSVQ